RSRSSTGGHACRSVHWSFMMRWRTSASPARSTRRRARAGSGVATTWRRRRRVSCVEGHHGAFTAGTEYSAGVCRLFGFRSVIPSQVHRSLVAADNALGKQSERHPDGWGVAYYVDGAPHVTRSAAGALDDALFRRVSGSGRSETVVAHVRKATQGNLTVLNSHPFQYGRWVMAHNGDIPRFAAVREALEQAIAPRLRRFILGDTDSERIFFLFLSELAKYGELG